MGFLSAVREMSQMESSSGIEQLLTWPLDTQGGEIRVYLRVKDVKAQPLDVEGVKKVDVADFKSDPKMKRKYLWHDRVGSNVSWGFTPIYKSGKPPGKEDKRKEKFLGASFDWAKGKGCHLFKIKSRVLDDYEKEKAFTEGSVDRIMKDLPGLVEKQLGSLDKNRSYIVVFGVEGSDGEFVYPGDIPSCVTYCIKKLEDQGLLDTSAVSGNANRRCALCGKAASKTTTLDQVFKFSTNDKVSVLPGLDKAQEEYIFPICLDCQARLSSGRSYIESHLTNTNAIGGIRIWAIPEVVGTGSQSKLKGIVSNLQQNFRRDNLSAPGQKVEEGFFHVLAREGQGLVFHFVFWEQNNSQELVHLMVEDVPPERLVFLESSWKTALGIAFDEIEKGVDLDSCIKSLYKTLYDLAGKSEAERQVMRDFVLEVLGHLLSGAKAPVEAFKQVVVSRLSGFTHQAEKWSEVRNNLKYAAALVEFMSIVNAHV